MPIYAVTVLLDGVTSVEVEAGSRRDAIAAARNARLRLVFHSPDGTEISEADSSSVITLDVEDAALKQSEAPHPRFRCSQRLYPHWPNP